MSYDQRSSSKWQDESSHQVASDRRKSSLEILNDAISSWEKNDDYRTQTRFGRCHPNTRVAILKKIMDWIRCSDSEAGNKHIMWLNGPVGAGKSTIVHTIIELCFEQEVVIATFLFDRTDGTRNHAGSLVAALAYQIYHFFPAMQSQILAAIDIDPVIFTRSLEHQFAQLITKPFLSACSLGSSWISDSYCVIAIDGLDECIVRKEQLQLLSIISDAIRQTNLPILFLIASRPEHDIRSMFASKQMNDIYTSLCLDETHNPYDDIRIFLQDSFHEIKATHLFKSSIPAYWPAADIVETLVEESSGQFFYPAAVVRYLQSTRQNPYRRLETVMGLRPTWNSKDRPFTQLDGIYAMIISSVQDIQRVLYALSLYAHQVFQDSHHDLCQFISLREEYLEELISDLGPLVSIEINPDPNRRNRSRLRFLHASLHDFLMDPARSKELYMGIEVYRTEHLAHILHYIALASGV